MHQIDCEGIVTILGGILK